MGGRDIEFISDALGDDRINGNPYFFDFLMEKHIRTFFAHYGGVSKTYRDFYKEEPSRREVRNMRTVVFMNRVLDAVVNDPLYYPRKFFLWFSGEDKESDCCGSSSEELSSN